MKNPLERYLKEKNSTAYKLVAFDLDGTLIRGDEFEYSWKLVWQWLGYPMSYHQGFFRKYLKHKLTYEQWCEECLFHFKLKELKRIDFKEIIKPLYLTKNLKETIKILRHNNIKTAIVSGGMDTFLEEMIPDYKDLFDEIFINQITFDQNGIIEKVIPTQYDYEGKYDGIEFICKKYKIQLNEVVFVGEGLNDKVVIKGKELIGKIIAYPPNAKEFGEVSEHKIIVDDLMEILNEIIA